MMTVTNTKQNQQIESLNASFSIPGVAQIVSGDGDLPKVQITTPQATAEIYLHGAHLTSWIPSGHQEIIFLSKQAQFQDGKAIRGGVPICFPWFNAKAGDPKAPSHGFVRTKAWELDSIVHEGNAIAVSLSTRSDESTRKWWPHDFCATQLITVGNQLKIALTVHNTGSTPLSFEEALHTYYRVGQIRDVRIRTLDGVSYQDNTDGNREKVQHGDNAFTQRTDNAYLNTQADLELSDTSLGRHILIGKQNSNNTVVWNPWQQLAEGMSDLGDDEWQQMVCVEAANIRASAVRLQPGEVHTMTVIIRVTESGGS